MTTPAHWTAFHRDEDGELLGYLATDETGTTPLTLFGFPLGTPTDEASAAEVLRRRGLAVLAEPWWLEEPGGGFRVQILSADPATVTVARADYGFVPPDSERVRLPVPTGERLRPYR